MDRERVWVALALLVAGCGSAGVPEMDAGRSGMGDVSAPDSGLEDAATGDAGVDSGADADVPCVADDCHEVDVFALPACVLRVANVGGPCDDGYADTFGDTCDAAGECSGTSCVSDLPCIVRAWNGSVCVDTAQTGETCDDDDAGTHTDECQSDGMCRGTACECVYGPCCDGCFFRAAGYICDPMRLVDAECQDLTGCAGGGRVLRNYYREVTCSGASAACDGPMTNTVVSVPTSCSDMGASCRGAVPMCLPC